MMYHMLHALAVSLFYYYFNIGGIKMLKVNPRRITSISIIRYLVLTMIVVPIPAGIITVRCIDLFVQTSLTSAIFKMHVFIINILLSFKHIVIIFYTY